MNENDITRESPTNRASNGASIDLPNESRIEMTPSLRPHSELKLTKSASVFGRTVMVPGGLRREETQDDLGFVRMSTLD